MPERDSDFDTDDLPSIQTENRNPGADMSADETVMMDSVNPPPQGKKAPKFKIDSLHVLVVTVVIFAIMMFLSYQQYIELEDARARVTELEQRLSSDVETVSQSGVALQVKLKEQKEKLDELWIQMDKLWASAWRRNQSEINSQSEKITALTKQLKETKTSLAGVEKALRDSDKNTGSIRGELAGMSAELESLTSQVNSLKKQVEAVKALEKKMASLESDNKALGKKVADQAEWINSINAFRQQTNKTLSQQESAIKSLQSSSATTP